MLMRTLRGPPVFRGNEAWVGIQFSSAAGLASHRYLFIMSTAVLHLDPILQGYVSTLTGIVKSCVVKQRIVANFRKYYQPANTLYSTKPTFSQLMSILLCFNHNTTNRKSLNLRKSRNF